MSDTSEAALKKDSGLPQQRDLHSRRPSKPGRIAAIKIAELNGGKIPIKSTIEITSRQHL